MSNNKLNALLQPLVESLGYEFVGLEYLNMPKQSVVRLYIDAAAGVGLEDCETVSREVAALLDVEDPISGHYSLEVSSPGLDRPLFSKAHYEQFTGEEVAISLFAPQDGRRKFKGLLQGIEGNMVKVQVDGTDYVLTFGNIAKARLVPDYDALMAGRKDDPE
jgi:ribosome maturation factor RimP